MVRTGSYYNCRRAMPCAATAQGATVHNARRPASTKLLSKAALGCPHLTATNAIMGAAINKEMVDHALYTEAKELDASDRTEQSAGKVFDSLFPGLELRIKNVYELAPRE